MTPLSPACTYLFGDCELDRDRGCLRCAGEEISLRHQSFQLLLYFLERPGILMTKDQLTHAIWSDTCVTDNALVQCITEIRRGLNDDPRNPRFIKTVPKIGYRLIVPVQTSSATPAVKPEAAPEEVPSSHSAGMPSPAAKPFPPAATGSNLLRIAVMGAMAIVLLSLYGDKIQAHAPSEKANILSAGIAHHRGLKTDTTPSSTDVGTVDVEAYRYYSLAVEKVKQFQNQQAISLLKKAIELDPRFAMAYARIGYAYAVMDFQPESAKQYLKRASDLSSSLPVLNRLYIDAWSAIAKADYATAIAVLQQITKQYPGQIEAYCQLSRLLRGQERVGEAGDLLKAAIQQNPDAKDLYNNYGLILIDIGKPLEALDAYKQYVALDPRNPNAHDSLGMAYQQAGQYSVALNEFNEALRLDPEFEPSIVHLGDAFYQSGQNQDAVREYKRYILIAGNRDAKAVGYGDLAVVYNTMNKAAEARSAAADELRADNKAVWNSLVFALEDRHFGRAEVMKKRLLTNIPNPERGSPPDLRMAFFYRGYLALKTGDAQAALGYFKSALQHLPPSSGIDSHEDCLANAYLELGMFPEAIAEYQRILKRNPHYPLAYFHLGQAYRRLHDATAAGDAFQHFLSSVPSADQDSPQIREARQPV